MTKYPSKYSNGKSVGPAQYIAEFICERIAKRNKLDLHYRFWVNEEWEKVYKGQLTAAYKLLKQYEPKAVLNALNSKEGSKIYSLRAPHLPAMIDKEQKILSSLPEPKAKNIERNILDKGRSDRSSKKSNILDKLRELDDRS